VALATTGHPLRGDQLPETTFGVRHLRLSRHLANGTRLEDTELPKEAQVSQGAGICGYRDVFFDAMLGALPTEGERKAERETLRRGLQCGRFVLDVLKSGTYSEVEYQFRGEPTSFGVLRFTPRPTPLPGAFPKLERAPAGAIATYCRDDDGSGARGCRHGDRSRLILAVEGGLLGAYAREADSLLARIVEHKARLPHVDAVARVYRDLEAHEAVSVVAADSCGMAFDGSLAHTASDPTAGIEFLDTLMDHATVCGTGHTGSVRDGTWKFVFAAKDEASAGAIEKALQKRIAELPTERPLDDKLSPNERKYRDALRRMLQRALKDVKPTRDGLRVQSE
jgi:hypothetical protein